MQTYGKTPVGKRMIRCGCTDDYARNDPETECFEDMDVCSGCGRYPWYRVKAAVGGKRRPDDGR